MPVTTPFVKVAATKAYGADVVLDGESVAEAQARAEAAGDAGGGLRAAEWALARSGCRRVLEAEFRRVRGNCLGALGREGDAALELQRALELARKQGARALEERVLRSMRNARGTVSAAASSST
jgi:hypothetical protein